MSAPYSPWMILCCKISFQAHLLSVNCQNQEENISEQRSLILKKSALIYAERPQVKNECREQIYSFMDRYSTEISLLVISIPNTRAVF